jgi:hypothetical protein
MSKTSQLLLEAWEARNDLYRMLFGEYTSSSPEKYAPPKVPTTDPSGVTESGGSGDPGDEDQRLTILTYAPDPQRPYWLYVTSGLSNPWYQEEPDEVSGFGYELLMKAPMQAEWPAQVLRTMAFYIFNHAAQLSPGMRVALNGPVSVHTPSDLVNLFIWYADEAPDAWYQLPSGGFGVFSAIGITDDECDFAERVTAGTWCIQEVLRQLGFGQITDPNRKSVMQRDDVGPIIQTVTMYAANFPDKPALQEE